MRASTRTLGPLRIDVKTVAPALLAVAMAVAASAGAGAGAATAASEPAPPATAASEPAPLATAARAGHPQGTAAAKEKPLAPKLVLVSTRRRTAGAIRVGVRVAVPLRSLGVTLNGHRVTTPLPHRRGTRAVVSLGTVHGARFGRNVVVVRAHSRNRRRSQTVRRVVVVRRSAPLVGVRRYEPIVQGRPARLDARQTRPARGGILRYRWRVIDTPRRARVSLRGADTPRPRLVASHPGRYHLALTITESTARGTRGARRSAGVRHGAPGAPGSHRFARAAQSLPSPTCLDPAMPAAVAAQSAPLPLTAAMRTTPLGPVASTPQALLPPGTRLETIAPTAKPTPPAAPPSGAAGDDCTLEIVTADVMPNTSAVGAAFDSRAQQTTSTGAVQTGIRIGATFIPTGTSGAWVTFLDATTLENLSTSRVTPGLAIAEYIDFNAPRFTLAGHALLLVISGAPGCCGGDWSVSDANDGFTIVRTLDQSQNEATQNMGLQLGTGGAATVGQTGELTGYLQQTVALDGGVAPYTFVDDDRVSFSTQTENANGISNTMQVGSQTYPGTLPDGWSAGYQVLVTDAALRPLLGTPKVFGTNGNTVAADSQQESQMASLLRTVAATPGSTVFVQSIGRPRPASAFSVLLGQAVAAVGGSQWMFTGLDGSGDYALVGGAPAPGQLSSPTDAAEASTKFSGGGSLRGMLRRRNDQALRPTLADPVAPGTLSDGTTPVPDYDLAKIVYQDPTPWPQTDTPGKLVATTWIARQVGMTGAACYQPARPDFRSDYCDVAMQPLSIYNAVKALSYSPTGAFTKFEFGAVQQELMTELDAIANVRTFIGSLQSEFGTDTVSASIDSEAIAGQLMDSIRYTEGSATSGKLSLAGSILYLASDIPEAGEALAPIASVLDVASELTAEDGEPEPYWEIQAQAEEVGREAADRLRRVSQAMDVYQDIIVSDYDKLTRVSRNSTSVWAFSDTRVAEAENSLEAGVTRWMWMAILPSAYDLVEVDDIPTGHPEKAYCVWSSAPATWQPWKHADSRTTFFPINTWEGGPAPFAMYGMLHGKTSSRGAQPVLQEPDLGGALFDSVEERGAGLVAPWVYERPNWHVQIPTQVVGSTKLRPGACGPGPF